MGMASLFIQHDKDLMPNHHQQPVYFTAHQVPSENGSALKGKNLLPLYMYRQLVNR